MKLLLSFLPVLFLVACGGGGGGSAGGGYSIAVPVLGGLVAPIVPIIPVIQAPSTPDPVAPVAPAPIVLTDADQTNAVKTYFPSAVLGTPDATARSGFVPFNADVSAAWAAGWSGKGINYQILNGTDLDANGLNAFDHAGRVADTSLVRFNGGTADTSKDYIVLVPLNGFTNPLASHSAGSLFVGAATANNNLPGFNPNIAGGSTLSMNNSNSGALVVQMGNGSTTNSVVTYGVPGANTNTQAVGVAAGFAAIVAQKFTLTPAQAGEILKRSSDNPAAGSYNLSLGNALAPSGRLR